MEPRIQYAQTKDGVSIAFWVTGQGMPLVAEPSGNFLLALLLVSRLFGYSCAWADRMADF